MPIYEYRCKACGQEFDKLVRMSTKTEDVECPQCGQRRAEKAISRIGAIGGAGLSAADLSSAVCGPSS